MRFLNLIIELTKKNLITKSRAEFKIGSHENPHPEYPLIARKKGWEGRVIIHADIDNTGKVTHIEILESSGYEALDSVSPNTLKNWKFTPAKFGDKFIEDSVTIPVNFVKRLKTSLNDFYLNYALYGFEPVLPPPERCPETTRFEGGQNKLANKIYEYIYNL